MKRSAQVLLVISGAILTGCGRNTTRWDDPAESSEVLTNNAYVAGHGYYHAPYHSFYPFPYNYYTPGRGYYHGGTYTLEPNQSGIAASSPTRAISSSSRGGFARSSTRVGAVSS